MDNYYPFCMILKSSSRMKNRSLYKKRSNPKALEEHKNTLARLMRYNTVKTVKGAILRIASWRDHKGCTVNVRKEKHT